MKFLSRSIPVLGVLFFYFYFATFGSLRWSTLALQGDATEAYQLLAKGYLMGRLGLSVDPDPRMATMPDPYDPQQNGCCRFFDSAYYKGHSYLVQGPLPVIAFYVPVKVLLGGYPSGSLAILFFGSLNFLFLYALLLRIKDDHFPGASELTLCLGGLSLGIGNIVLFHLGHPIFHFICIASSEGVMGIGAYCLYRAHSATPRQSAWMAWASFFIATAAAGRASFSTGAAVFVAVSTVWLLWSAEGRALSAERRASLLKAVWIPCSVVGALLMLHNYLRFENPLNFGLGYTVSSVKVSTSGFMDKGRVLVNILYNLKVDLMQRFLANEHFPFVRASYQPLFPPMKYVYYAEDTIGFFSLWPAGWLLLLLPAAVWQWRREAPAAASASRGHLESFVLVAGSMAATQALVVLAVSGSTFRYFGDFVPLLLLFMVLVTWLLLDLRAPSRWKGLLRDFFHVATLFGILATLTYSFCGFQCLFITQVPQVARFMDHLVGH